MSIRDSSAIVLVTLLACVVSAAEPTHRDLMYANVDGHALKLDLYLPKTGSEDDIRTPTVVWVHGGAWRSGSKNDVPIAAMIDQGFAIASVDYRLSPQAKFPAQIHDIKGAIRFLKAHADEYRLDRDRFVIAGSSAGGHLAALAGVSSGVPELEGTVGASPDEDSSVQAIVSFYGASNLQTILSQSTEHGLSVRVPALQLLLGGQPEEVSDLAKLASVVTHVDANDPPIWLIHGDADPQMPIEQSYELRAAYAGVKQPVKLDVVAGGKHGGKEFFTQDRLHQISTALLSTLGNTQKPLRFLFAGSSSTYWNDLPSEVAKIVSGADTGLIKAREVTAEIVGRSGSDIRVYQNADCRYEYGVKRGQSFLDKVREERFDYVVLMTVCRFIMGESDENPDGKAHRDAITRYCAEIRAAGGEPIFYEVGWGSGENEERGRQRIRELARQNDVSLYAPCSTAWARVRKERPDIALQHPNDSTHPGDYGHFLNLACFYATLSQTSPEGKLPRQFPVWPHHTKAEKETKKADLDATFAVFVPNDYQSRLPEWMRRNAGAGYVSAIGDDQAQYLERLAWETWQAVAKELPGR